MSFRVTHPNINRAPRLFERICELGMSVYLFLKMEGVTVSRQGSFVVIEFTKDIAAEKFEQVVKRGVRGT